MFLSLILNTKSWNPTHALYINVLNMSECHKIKLWASYKRDTQVAIWHIQCEGGITRRPTPAIGLKVEAAMASVDINDELVCPLGTPSFPAGAHNYDPKIHDLIKGVSKCMISIQEAQAELNEYRCEWVTRITWWGLHWWHGSKWTREWGQQRSSTAISRMVRQPTANCPEDCQTTAPSLQMKLQPPLWRWTSTDTWVQFITM